MCKKYIKNANESEISNLLFLNNLGLNDIIPVYIMRENKIIYNEESPLPVAALFDVNTFGLIYKDILKRLYIYKNNRFSSGLYSYINKEYPISRAVEFSDSYVCYLKEEFISIVNKYNILKGESDKYRLLLEFYNLVLCRFDEFLNYNVTEFSLLHGDFHTGNIVYSNSEKKYKMIDFEYLRFGMIELEITNFIVQLLDGGEYVENCFGDNITQILSQIYMFQNIDSKIMFELFFPMLLFFRLWRSLNEVNVKQALVKNTVINIAQKYLAGDYNECITNYSTV